MTNINGISDEYYHQKMAYENYVRLFHPIVLYSEIAYKQLYDTVSEEDQALAKGTLGDFYYEKYITKLYSSLGDVARQLDSYIKDNKLSDDEKDYLLYYKPKLEERLANLALNPNSSTSSIANPAYQKHAWFQVGVMLATGKLENYLTDNRKGFKNGFSAPKIATKLGNVNYQKTILAQVKKYKNNKNIFNDSQKLNKIINYCRENNLHIIPQFMAECSVHDIIHK